MYSTKQMPLYQAVSLLPKHQQELLYRQIEQSLEAGEKDFTAAMERALKETAPEVLPCIQPKPVPKEPKYSLRQILKEVEEEALLRPIQSHQDVNQLLLRLFQILTDTFLRHMTQPKLNHLRKFISTLGLDSQFQNDDFMRCIRLLNKIALECDLPTPVPEAGQAKGVHLPEYHCNECLAVLGNNGGGKPRDGKLHCQYCGKVVSVSPIQ